MSGQEAEINEAYSSFGADKLVVETILPFDVYIKDGGKMIPLFNKGTMYTGRPRAFCRKKASLPFR